MEPGVFFPSFDQDGCVIEEQEDHLVMAVRIPKTTINANMALLSTLADLAGASMGSVRSVTAPTPVAPVRKVRLKQWQTNVMAGAATLGLGMFGLPQLIPVPGFAAGRPPVEYQNWRMQKAVFQVGEPIEIDMQYRLDRRCAVSVDRSVRRVDDDSPGYSSRDYGAGSGKLSAEFIDRRYVLHTALLTPGEYYYSGVTQSDCSDGNYIIPHKRLTFRVE